MKRIIALATAALILAGPAQADEIEAAIEAALEAYRAGDLGLAREEIEFAATLIGQKKAEGLSDYLPPAQPGWRREDVAGAAQGMAAFGGGIMAAARYTGAEGRFEIEIMADNQLVASMAAMLGNPALMATMGTVHREGRQKYVVTHDGEIQTLVDNRVLVKVTGQAPIEAKRAHFRAMDLEALGAY